MHTHKNIFRFWLLSLLLFLAANCKQEDITLEETAIYEAVKGSIGFAFYKNDSSILESSDESPHADFFRVRFNAIAQAALIDNGKLPADSVFPQGSLVVKELYDSEAGEMTVLSVMKKDSTNSNSINGWVWVEFEADGALHYSSGDKGGNCKSCHSNNDRDFVRLFNLFP